MTAVPRAARRLARAALALAILGCHDSTGVDVGATPIACTLYRGTGGTLSAGDIYVIAPDGSGARRLVDSRGAEFENSPAWSPDGRRLAFGRLVLNDPRDVSKGAVLSLWLVDADGSHQRRLAAVFDGGAQPAWSPDGTRLSFGKGQTLWVANLDGSDAHPVATGVSNGGAVSQSWSPDGTRILYAKGEPTSTERELWTVAPDGSGAARVPLAGCTTEGAWSPDGARIAFADCTDIFHTTLAVARADGSARAALTSGPADRAPVWSPDGAMIAFERYASALNGQAHLALVTPATGTVRDATPTAYSIGAPSWRP